ncbi:MAG TPA: hypothetical protein VGD63_13245 [Steroidobacteraceae bacterium]
MRNITLVAAAVSAVLGTALAQADTPSLATVQAAITAKTAAQYWISGSSAAKNGTKAFITSQICGGSLQTFTSAAPVSNPDFNAWACTATAGPNSGAINVIYYRAEGGSVVGVYPIINNTPIFQLDLTSGNTTCAVATTPANTYNCPIAGTSLGNGPSDSWGPSGVAKTVSDLGISDLEPDAFVGNNSPYAAAPPAGYAANTFGAAHTQAQLHALPHSTIFQQTFGIVVNTSLGTNVLSKSAIANILSGNYIDWHSVPAFGAAAPGAGVTAASTNIFVCNREVGSGTRTSAAVYFLGDHCAAGASSIAEGGNDNYATSDELVCVNNNGAAQGAPAGSIAIGYASVDNASKIGAGTSNPNVQFVNINGVAQSNYNSASGQNDYAYEATEQANAGSPNPKAAGFTTFIVPKLQAIGTAPQSAQVNALPGQPATNIAQLPLQVSGAIFTTDFDRGAGGGNSCNAYTSIN